MKYITGVYALNLPSSDGTPGDWHFSALDWNRVKTVDSSDSPFGEWGLHAADVPLHGTMMVANHIRACLDLIAQGNYGTAQGMRDDFICDDKYTPIIFDKIMLLYDSQNWKEIDTFMGHEYLCKWLEYKKSREELR